MLLAVIDLAERGSLAENRIRYVDTLEGFSAYAEAVRPDKSLEPYLPFYHLSGESFWHLEGGRDGRPYHSTMLNRSASLDPELHRLLRDSPSERAEFREALIVTRLADERDEVARVARERRSANEYECDIRRATRIAEDRAAYAGTDEERAARSRSFRRLVLQAYDYRCAATGLRIIVPGVQPLVDAAHLIPFRESGDDRPTNGMALQPTYHRALDRRLIAPGPDMKWHVAPVLDPRIPDYRSLLDLAGKPVIYHGAPAHGPSPEALDWRIQRLLTP